MRNKSNQLDHAQHGARKPNRDQLRRSYVFLTPRAVMKGLCLIASLALIGYFFDNSDLGNAFNETWIDANIRDRGIEGSILFLAMGMLFTALGLPRQIIAFLAGYAFGLITGTLLGSLAALMGCLLTFLYARLFGRRLLRDQLGKRAAGFDHFVRQHPFSMTLLIRLLPVGSNLLTNLAAGVSSARLAPFLAASFIGFLPQTLVFALVGSGINVAPVLRIGTASVLFVASAMLGVYLYHRHRQGLSNSDFALGEIDRS